MVTLINAGAYPCVPSKGSVGASGDLAPLAHMTGVLMGIGQMRVGGRVMPAVQGLKAAGLAPIDSRGQGRAGAAQRHPDLDRAGLAGLFAAENVFARRAGGRRHVGGCRRRQRRAVRSPHPRSARPARPDRSGAALLELMAGSEIRRSHIDCDRVQDPYSLRCQPQVMGAALDMLRHAAGVLSARPTPCPTIRWCSPRRAR